MKCPNCGLENRRNAHSCRRCGAVLAMSDEAQAVSVAVTPNILRLGQAQDVVVRITNKGSDTCRELGLFLKDLRVVVDRSEVWYAELLPGATWTPKLAIEVIGESKELVLPFLLRWKNQAGESRCHRAELAFTVQSRTTPPPPVPTPMPHSRDVTVSTPAVRDLLTIAFDDEELAILCYDHFRPVYEQFSTGMSKTQKIQRLIKHCGSHRSFDQLFRLVQDYNPVQFARFAARLRSPSDHRVNASPSALETSPQSSGRAGHGRSLPGSITVSLPGASSPKATAQVFLSYAREDREEVENIYRELSGAGFKPWMDTQDILPGEMWKSSIQRAIRGSHFFLVCMSKNSVNKRGWIQREIRSALDLWQEKLDSDIYLIPVRLEDCEAPEGLRDFQWVDLFEADGWARLVEAIRVGIQRRAEEESAR